MSNPARIIEALVDDLRPVRPLPRLDVSFAAALAAIGLLGTAWLALAGLRAGLVAALRAGDAYLAVAVSLGGALLFALLAGLAAMRPDRELISLRAGAAASLTLVAGALGALQLAPYDALGAPSAMDLTCLLKSVAIGSVSVTAFLAFAARGWPARPLLAAASVALTAGSLGALLVHLQCALSTTQHVLCGHGAGSLVTLVVFALPGAWWLRRSLR